MYGYLGSAWATTFVFLTMTVICYVLGQKYYPIPYPIFSDALYIIATTMLVYVVNLYEFTDLIVAAVVHTGVILAWLGVVYLIERNRYILNSK